MPKRRSGLSLPLLSDGFLIEHVRKRRLGLDPRDGTGAHHHFFDHLKNVFLRGNDISRSSCVNVRLTVGAQIFVAGNT